MTMRNLRPLPTTPILRALAIVFALGLVATACSSDGNDTINLSQDGLTTGAEGGSVDSEAVGEPVEFTYETFDGERVSFSDLPEAPVVLNFFASWCPTCIAEMPDFETVSQNLAGEVVFLGLATQDRAENAVELVDQTGVTYAVGNDQNGDVFGIFKGLGMPTTVFLNADRTVANVHTGVLDVDSLTDAVNTHLLS